MANKLSVSEMREEVALREEVAATLGREYLAAPKGSRIETVLLKAFRLASVSTEEARAILDIVEQRA